MAGRGRKLGSKQGEEAGRLGTFSCQEMEEVFGSTTISNKLETALKMPPIGAVPKPEIQYKSIPEECFRPGEVPPKVEVDISPGVTLRCIVGHIYSPTHFYVIPYETYNELEAYQKLLNDYVNKTLDANLQGTFRPDTNQDLIPGIYVYVKVPRIPGVDETLEWHRAKVIDNPEYPMCRTQSTDERIKVRLVDFGDFRLVDIKNIRYMSKNFPIEFPIVGVQCEIGFWDIRHLEYMDKLTRIPNLKWPYKTCEKLIKRLYGQFLAVRFLSCYTPERSSTNSFDPAPEIRWSIRANVIVNKSTQLPGGVDPVLVDPTLKEDRHPKGEFSTAVLTENVCDEFIEDIEELLAQKEIQELLEQKEIQELLAQMKIADESS